ncbi:MAG: hypothetical protein H7X94_01720, partial [Vallitaleaceae bacterium]|nr:hypothetical protein [Vallitaleaceae bacterium]
MERLRKILLYLLFLMPFFQGLYFYVEIFIAMVLICLLLLLSAYVQKGLWIEMSFTTFFLGGLFILYFLTCFYGIDLGMSLIGAMKMLLYFMFYLLYTQLYTQDYKEKVIAIVIYSCVAAAVFGILSLFIPVLSEHLIQKERLGGIFQYANTYGLYCIIGLVLIIRQKEKSFFEIWAMVLI